MLHLRHNSDAHSTILSARLIDMPLQAVPALQAVETSPFVVVGVDFGTTYTGVAFTHSDDPDFRRVTIIRDWPGAGIETRVKVPTEISYINGNPSRWGWQLAPGAPRFGGFKLLLDPVSGSQAYNDDQLTLSLDPGNPAMSTTLRQGSSATTMVSDYLRLVYAEVMRILSLRFAGTIGTIKMKFIITTPAMWSPAAQHNTLMAAKAAGFGSRPQDVIEAASEPEAAASYALRDLGLLSSQVNNNNPSETHLSEIQLLGKQVIVCDAGGGTVDIVSYAIDQLQPCLRVSETTPPRGGLCGATSLDHRFLQLLRERLGSQAHLLDGRHAGRGSRLMVSFDNSKRTFGSNEFEDDVLIEHNLRTLAPDDDNGIDEDYVTLSHQDMKSIFDPVVDKVIALVDSQLQEARAKEPGKPVTGIILVGGFGESVYLTKRLKTWAESQTPPLFLFSPTESWAAIAKGAVCYGLESIVHHRVLPCHYGVVLGQPFDPAIHDPAYNLTRPFDGAVFNVDFVTWFAKKGERVDKENRITVPFVCDADDRYASIPVELRTCRYDTPPLSRRDARVLQAPTVTIKLGDIPFSAIRHRQVGGIFGIGGRDTYLVEGFTLEMVTSSASVKFELWCKGVLLATQEVDPTFIGTS
ncbi:hypothetical protein V8F20_009418 [Naviculisporaceae sp. PSN 640]